MMPGMMPFMMPPQTGSAGKGKNGKNTNGRNNGKTTKKRGGGRKKKTTKKKTTKNTTSNTTTHNIGHHGHMPSPLSSPERRKEGYDIFGGSPITADDLQSLLSPNGNGHIDFAGGMARGQYYGNDGQHSKLSPRYSETGSDGGVDFLGDIDQMLASYKDDELVDTLDRVNLDENDLVPFDLQQGGGGGNGSGLHHTMSASSMTSNMSVDSVGSMSSMQSFDLGTGGSSNGSSMASMVPPGERQGGRKKKSRPKLEQMPSDAFQNYGMDLVSPFTGSFEWANQEGTSAPNSMMTPNPLGSPTNLFSPNGNMLVDLDGSDL